MLDFSGANYYRNFYWQDSEDRTQAYYVRSTTGEIFGRLFAYTCPAHAELYFGGRIFCNQFINIDRAKTWVEDELAEWERIHERLILERPDLAGKFSSVSVFNDGLTVALQSQEQTQQQAQQQQQSEQHGQVSSPPDPMGGILAKALMKPLSESMYPLQDLPEDLPND